MDGINHPKAWVAILIAIIVALGTIIAAYIGRSGDSNSSEKNTSPSSAFTPNSSTTNSQQQMPSESDSSFPTTPEQASSAFGGEAARWMRLEENSNGWKFRPGSQLATLKLPNSNYCIHYWDNFQSHRSIGPIEVQASEATIYYSSYGFSGGC